MPVFGFHASHEQIPPSELLLREYADLGVDEFYLHHVGQDQDEFLDVFGARVLPELT
ncbi:hypothetical protein ACQPYV_14725 [Micromonospora saelicesensis]|uniref:hypothetical protein n=1 Tax=Micromonospora saelicesensis TaxID=285676 RepID=UPI003D8C342F